MTTPLSLSHESSPSSAEDDDRPTSSSNKKKRKKKLKKQSTSKVVRRNTVWISESGLESKDAFHVDTTPDPDNVTYEGIYSGNVATYRRRFPCVGLSKYQHVELNDGRSKARKSEKKTTKQQRYYSNELTAGDDVIVSVSQQKNISPLDEILKLNSETESVATTELESTMTAQRYISDLVGGYNKSLIDDPHNVRLWLEFISLQDSFLEWSQFEGGEGKRRLAIEDRKMAIFERALESNHNSVDLLLGHMTLVGSSWEPERVVKRWKDLVFKQPNIPQLWIGYIDYCTTQFSEFTVGTISALYSKCISTLALIEEGSLKSHSPLPDSLSWTLTIFCHYCDFLNQTGQSEKAVSCYRALIEFNLCMPTQYEAAPLISQVEELQAFWSSPAPKIGESGAVGWANWTNSKQQDPQILGLLNSDPCLTSDPREVIEEDDDDELNMISGLSIKEAWLRLEDHRAVNHVLPWRGEEDPLDPDRMVSFDDIKQTLFRLPDRDLQLQLVLRYLKFLGALTPTFSTPNRISIEHVIEVSSHFLDVFGNILPDGLSLCPLLSPGVGSTLADIATDSLHALSSSLSDTLLGVPTLPVKNPAISNTIVHMCNQALSLLPVSHSQTVIGQVWITHHLLDLMVSIQSGANTKQLRGKIKAIQKLIKSLLKLENHRNNVTLWNCCAIIEHLLGHSVECIHIYNTILSSSPSYMLYSNMAECVLGLQPTLIEEKQAKTHLELAVNALVCLSEGQYSSCEDVSPVRTLKAKTHYEDLATNVYCTPSANNTERLHYGLCHAYFEYMTNGVAPANKVLNDLYLSLSSQPPDAQLNTVLEKLRYRQARLLHHSSLVQPVSLRVILEDSLTLGNPWFIARFISLEEQSFISTRVRRYMDKHAYSKPGVWVYGVCAELRRYCKIVQVGAVMDGTPLGSLRRVVALLEKGTESGVQSPLLWRLYMAIQVSLIVFVINLILL